MSNTRNNVYIFQTPVMPGGGFCARLMGAAQFVGPQAFDGVVGDAILSRIERCFEVLQL